MVVGGEGYFSGWIMYQKDECAAVVNRVLIGCLSCVAMSAEAAGLLLDPLTSSGLILSMPDVFRFSLSCLIPPMSQSGRRAGSYLTSLATTDTEEGGEEGEDEEEN